MNASGVVQGDAEARSRISTDRPQHWVGPQKSRHTGLMGFVATAGSTRLNIENGVIAANQSTGMEEVAFDGFIVPGLRDAHFHPVTYAASLVVPSLKSARDFADIGSRLQAAATGLVPGRPLSALRLDDESLIERRLPTRHDLDAIISDRPVIVHRYCGHIAVANSAAIAAPPAPVPTTTTSASSSVSGSSSSAATTCAM